MFKDFLAAQFKKFFVFCSFILSMIALCVPAFAVDTSVADMFALVDLSAVSTGQKALYAVLIICTLISVAWAIVTKIVKRAPRAV